MREFGLVYKGFKCPWPEKIRAKLVLDICIKYGQFGNRSSKYPGNSRKTDHKGYISSFTNIPLIFRLIGVWGS